MEKRTSSRPESSKNNSSTRWFRYTGLASEMMVLLGGATFLGFKADQWLAGDFPLFIIIFPLIALAIILWRLIKITGKKDG